MKLKDRIGKTGQPGFNFVSRTEKGGGQKGDSEGCGMSTMKNSTRKRKKKKEVNVKDNPVK